MQDKARRTIEKYGMLTYGDSVVVGLSGGADSCALLWFLRSIREEFGLSLTAVHLDHGIRGEEAAEDAAFAKAFCEQLNVPFRLYRRDVPAIAAERGIGLEECGRALRYELFAREAEAQNAKIATAHTRSDLVETMLLHMVRGCSVGGLRGIPPVRGRIIRPLIECGREDVEAYCATHGIAYRTDSTNLSPEYTRNKLRLQVMPLLREINPSVEHAMARLAEDAASDEAYLHAKAEKLADAYRQCGDARLLQDAEQAVAGRALVILCGRLWDIVPEHRHVEAALMCLKQGRGWVNLTQGCRLLIQNHQIFFLSQEIASEKPNVSGDWQHDLTEGEIITPALQKIIVHLMEQTKYDIIRKNHQNVFQNSLDYDTIKHAIFRYRQAGDSFCRAGRSGTKTLKKLFNELKISPDRRWQTPLLVCDNRVAWIAGVGVGEGFQVTHATRRVAVIQFLAAPSDEAAMGADS